LKFSRESNSAFILTGQYKVIIITPLMALHKHEFPSSSAHVSRAAALSREFAGTSFWREMPVSQEDILRMLLEGIGGITGPLGKHMDAKDLQFRVLGGAYMPIVMASGPEADMNIGSLHTVHYPAHPTYTIIRQETQWTNILTFNSRFHVSQFAVGMKDDMHTLTVGTLRNDARSTTLWVGAPEPGDRPANMVMIFDTCQLQEPGFSAVAALNIIHAE
jgi:hypothetical protein